MHLKMNLGEFSLREWTVIQLGERRDEVSVGGQKIGSFPAFSRWTWILSCSQAEGGTQLGSLRQFRFSNSLTANEYTPRGRREMKSSSSFCTFQVTRDEIE
jgi:hypothetical protein